MTAIAEIPKFSNRWLSILASGWRAAAIARMSSGGWVTVTSGVDRALSGEGGQRPNQALPDLYGDKSIRNYLNPAAFALPDLGTNGRIGVATILGPGSLNFDAGLSRLFRIRERRKLELRAEGSNILNRVNSGNPQLSLNSFAFGQILNAGSPRIMQFALKYVF